MKLYLIRHGETDWNKEGRLQGRRDIPMNERGIAQSGQVGDCLRDMGLCAGAEENGGLLIVSSPLKRARMCADAIADRLGCAREKIVTEASFIERSFGNSEGEIWRPEMREHERENLWEDMETLVERARIGIGKYLDRAEQAVIIVAHGAILKAVLAVLANEKLAYGDNNSAVRQGCIVAVEYGKNGLESVSEIPVTGLPGAFLNRMKEMLGAEYEAFLASFGQENYQALRINPLKRAEKKAWEDLKGSFHLTPVSWEENGYYYGREDQPGKHPFHDAGAYYIQEPSAMMPVNLLEAQPGEKVLDLCAAPGGKSTQIAAAMRGVGLLVSNEIHPARARILSENMERLGVRNACVTNESPTHLSEKLFAYFDRILVDAPCSGEGMFRKNETACEEWSAENVEMCAARQDEILDSAALMLRPGGRMVYSTCTFAPQENEGSILRFLERHPDFELIPIDKNKFGLPEGVCDGRPEWADNFACAGENRESDIDRAQLRGTLRLWPHHIKGEGHFAAVLQKKEGLPEGYASPQTGSAPEGHASPAAGGLEPAIAPGDPAWKAWREFAEATLLEVDRPTETKLLRFGENLYEAPACLPSLKGLKVLRPGLQLGTLKKDRFEPAHALAMALSDASARHACHVSVKPDGSVNGMTAENYLNGRTFPAEGEKGWYLISVDGFSLGWGKLAGGIMKNHYPKGLRRP